MAGLEGIISEVLVVDRCYPMILLLAAWTQDCSFFDGPVLSIFVSGSYF
jgi:hypothetical protein